MRRRRYASYSPVVTDAVLQRFGVTSSDKIGHGGDATVYALGAHRVVRVLHSTNSPIARIAAFYDELAGQDPGFELPRVLEHGEIDGTAYSVDRLIPGRPLIDVLPELAGDRRQRALDSYLDSADAIGRLHIERPLYGEVLADPPLQRSTWTEFLLDRAEAALSISSGRLAADIPRLGDVIGTVRRHIEALPAHVERRLVHGDYFPGNVMISDDLKVSGVIDFGTLTVMGDPAMDVASAIVFIEVARPAFGPVDVDYLTERAVRARGSGFVELIRVYREYITLRLAPYAEREDPRLYAWCVRSLRSVLEG
jgi:aminoglycoside phosphotransferase (APT) family kinase protein